MSESDPVTDELVALVRAQGDQAKAQVTEFASVLATFHKILREGGVGQDAADGMTQQYFIALLLAAGRATNA
jgi:hypothetical protein